MNMVMTGFEYKKQIVIVSVFERSTLWTVDIVEVPVSRRNIVIIHEVNLTLIINVFLKNFLLLAVCPHSPFAIRAGRHIGLQLLNAIFSVSCINSFLLALNNYIHILLLLLSAILFEYNNISSWLS